MSDPNSSVLDASLVQLLNIIDAKKRAFADLTFRGGFFEHGGQLPDNWREIARVIDLSGLVECLSHEELPIEVKIELLELIKATLEHRDPNC